MRSMKRVLAVAAAVVTTAASGLVAALPAAAVPNTIPLTITNKSALGQSVYVYILGTDLASGQDGWADANGTFHKWPSTGNVPVDAPDASIAGPANGQSKTIQLPKFSGRVYFSYGQKLSFKVVLDGRLVQPAVENPSDPNRNKLFNWTEYTLNGDGLWINSTQVDFFSAPYQTGLKKSDGSIISTGRLKTDGYQAVINALNGTPGWNNLVQKDGSGNVLRVLSPAHGIDAGTISANVMDDYTNRVWSKYSSQDLVVRPFIENPSIVYYGRVSGNVMNFRNSSGANVASFNKPSSGSILGCAGDLFAPNDDVVGPIARTVCAGLIRSSALSNPNQPDTNAASYYQDSVTNYYAKYIHQQMVNGKAYAFAFDDVNNQESLVHDANPSQAYIQLDPFSGSATAIGDEGSGGNNGGGDNGGGQGNGTGGTLPQGSGTITATAASNLCVDIPWGDATNSTQVQVAGCNNGTAQAWTRSGDTIQALGKCLDVRSSGVAAGTPVQIYTCNGTAAQVWKYNTSTKALVNPQSGRCLDMSGGNPLHDGQLLQIWDCTGDAPQQWNLQGASGGLPTGTSTLKSAGHNLCVDIPGANPADSTQVQIANCSGNAAQTWTRGSDGTIRAMGACLDIRSSGTTDGTAVQVYHCNGTAAQQWVYDSGTQALKNPQSGKCLDVPSSQFNDGQKLQIWTCNSSGAQKWTLG